MRLKKLYIFALCVALMGVLSGCGEYQALLKSNDPELKYQKAIEYFNNVMAQYGEIMEDPKARAPYAKKALQYMLKALDLDAEEAKSLL